MPNIQNSKPVLDYLGTLGSDDRGDSLALGETAKKLVGLAEFLITEAQKNLNKAGAEATGELEASIAAENMEVQGNNMSIDIVLLDRYRFTDQGVKGVESGKGKYQFKTKYPNKKMATAILKWLRKRSISARNKPTIGKSRVSKNETKNIKIRQLVDSADDYKSLAYAVSTNIKKRGIKPTYFFTNAVKATEKKCKAEIAAGYKIDIINSLK